MKECFRRQCVGYKDDKCIRLNIEDYCEYCFKTQRG